LHGVARTLYKISMITTWAAQCGQNATAAGEWSATCKQQPFSTVSGKALLESLPGLGCRMNWSFDQFAVL
jgi:hypothetical protein